MQINDKQEEILGWREEKYFFFALVPHGFSARLSRAFDLLSFMTVKKYKTLLAP